MKKTEVPILTKAFSALVTSLAQSAGQGDLGPRIASMVRSDADAIAGWQILAPSRKKDRRFAVDQQRSFIMHLPVIGRDFVDFLKEEHVPRYIWAVLLRRHDALSEDILSDICKRHNVDVMSAVVEEQLLRHVKPALRRRYLQSSDAHIRIGAIADPATTVEEVQMALSSVSTSKTRWLHRSDRRISDLRKALLARFDDDEVRELALRSNLPTVWPTAVLRQGDRAGLSLVLTRWLDAYVDVHTESQRHPAGKYPPEFWKMIPMLDDGLIAVISASRFAGADHIADYLASTTRSAYIAFDANNQRLRLSRGFPNYRLKRAYAGIDAVDTEHLRALMDVSTGDTPSYDLDAVSTGDEETVAAYLCENDVTRSDLEKLGTRAFNNQLITFTPFSPTCMLERMRDTGASAERVTYVADQLFIHLMDRTSGDGPEFWRLFKWLDYISDDTALQYWPAAALWASSRYRLVTDATLSHEVRFADFVQLLGQAHELTVPALLAVLE